MPKLPTKKPSLVKKPSLSRAKKKAWAAFSIYIRTRDCIKTTQTKTHLNCVTCGRLVEIKKAHASHFIPGRHNATLFDERGVHGSCYACNVVLGGNGPAYYKFMLAEWGQEIIDELLRNDNQTVKYTVDDYEQLEQTYKNKLADFEQHLLT